MSQIKPPAKRKRKSTKIKKSDLEKADYLASDILEVQRFFLEKKGYQLSQVRTGAFSRKTKGWRAEKDAYLRQKKEAAIAKVFSPNDLILENNLKRAKMLVGDFITLIDEGLQDTKKKIETGEIKKSDLVLKQSTATALMRSINSLVLLGAVGLKGAGASGQGGVDPEGNSQNSPNRSQPVQINLNFGDKNSDFKGEIINSE